MLTSLLTVGEDVEFDLQINEEKGKPFAVNVTGPGGAEVMGLPRTQPRSNNRRDD